MENITYKPYKRNLNQWNHIKGKEREDMGRVIITIEVGEKRTLDKKTKETTTESVTEEIYLDILKSVMIDKLSYKTMLYPSNNPALVISYDGRLVIHNDKVNMYVQELMKILPLYNKKVLILALKDFVLNENIGEKYSQALKKLTENINKKLERNYPPALIGMVLKEYICDELREPPFNKEDEDLQYADYKELMEKAAQVLSYRMQNQSDEISEQIEYDLKEELFYRFIQGNLKMGESI